jgi:hypothetical protein
VCCCEKSLVYDINLGKLLVGFWVCGLVVLVIVDWFGAVCLIIAKGGFSLGRLLLTVV